MKSRRNQTAPRGPLPGKVEFLPSRLVLLFCSLGSPTASLCFCPSSSAPDPKNHHIIKFGTNIDLSDAKRSVRLDQ